MCCLYELSNINQSIPLLLFQGLVFVCTFAYWLFYVVQVTEGARASAAGEGEALEYRALVAYASSLTDTLLFILFVAIILIEIRHVQPMYYIKVCFEDWSVFQRLI